ncbi:3-hydroxyisobutyrate dehydrogenase [Aspergillus crustosus]
MSSSIATSVSSSHPKLGWIGLGSMGQAMALNVQRHLTTLKAPVLHFYNRTATRGEPLTDIGGIQSPSIQDLINGIDICFISVSDDNAATSIIKAILETSLEGKIIVDTSTVHPDVSSWAQQAVTEKGGKFVAAPVFGASPVAQQGRLLVVVAGADDAVSAIEPFLVGVLARKILRVGEDAAKATLLKTTGNFLTAGLMELVAESLVFATKADLPIPALQSLLEEQYGALPHTISKRMTEGHYLPARGNRPWSDLQLAVKDVGLGVSCAEKVGAALPIAEVVLGHYEKANEYADTGNRALDSSSMFGVLRQKAGLEFESELVRERDSV